MTRCGCPNEDTQQTTESPGIVELGESIVFACIHPETAPERGVAMLPKEKLKKTDLSVCRGAYSSHDDLLEHVVKPQLSKKPERIYKGYYWVVCKEIRDIIAVQKKENSDKTAGAFCVVDDALPDYTAHAVIGFSRPSDNFWSKHDREAARGDLLIAVQCRGLHGPPDQLAQECPGLTNRHQGKPNIGTVVEAVGPGPSEKLEKLYNELSDLTVLEFANLVETLKDKWS